MLRLKVLSIARYWITPEQHLPPLVSDHSDDFTLQDLVTFLRHSSLRQVHVRDICLQLPRSDTDITFSASDPLGIWIPALEGSSGCL